MPRGLFYFVMAWLFGLMGFAIDWAWIARQKYSPAYFGTLAVVVIPAALCLFLGVRERRRRS
jgi:hypothetical protein